MVRTKYQVLWDKGAYRQLDAICEYLKQESVTASTIVRQAILSRTKSLAKAPLIYETDKLKVNNDGTYRAITIYSYRISYRVVKSAMTIKIFSIRHTSREPLEH